MRGFIIFIGIAVVNMVLLVYIGVSGVIIADLSLIITLLILLFENQKRLLRKLYRKKTAELKQLQEQRKDAELIFDRRDLPTESDINEIHDSPDPRHEG